ncbi:MAG: class I SAM-dependent methyltransferase [Blastochloris sp.]|nr:class I SAM-dependent methyltransferase [Blastochloris sp.]
MRRRMPGITDDYEEEYHQPYSEQGKAIHAHTLRHFADLMKYKFAGFKSGQETFLDVGCSTGRVLELAKTMGFVTTGLDYSKWACDCCTKLGHEVRCGSLEGAWPESGIFDVIHSSHTIEHVPDPVVYISEFRRLLKPDGFLMLAFPNYLSLPRFYWGAKWPIWCLDSHLWQFTLGQIESLLRINGFQIVESKALHGYKIRNPLLRYAFDLSELLRLGDGAQILAKPSE